MVFCATAWQLADRDHNNQVGSFPTSIGATRYPIPAAWRDDVTSFSASSCVSRRTSGLFAASVECVAFCASSELTETHAALVIIARCMEYVVGFDFVSPTIGEGLSASARCGQVIGQLCSFQNMLERGVFETNSFATAATSGFRFGDSSARARSAFRQDFDHGSSRRSRRARNAFFLHQRAFLTPPRIICPRFKDAAADGFFDAHTRGRIAFGAAREAKSDALWISPRANLIPEVRPRTAISAGLSNAV